jgi:hypothetical protein
MWSRLAAGAPDLAAFAQSRFEGRIAYLATTRADGSPRVHPVTPFIVAGGLFVYMEPTSPKGHDLRRDNRYALHCTVEDTEGGGGEVFIAGRAEVIADVATRELVFAHARTMGNRPRERYVLFMLGVDEAMTTTYEGDTPVRAKWRAGAQP